ncbi:glycosyltransferase family 2 protein [Sphingobacterium tabacisoli]|uniref:Glycosyltransferase family 2 protein n=1 Tax=Sphingobacterium tabacisoli TaxID=2044855 RepID=A0ABW5L0D3_9SPHI|nr:glycosyltransferase family A protein [Sphingobacterium tabacisoli]
MEIETKGGVKISVVIPMYNSEKAIERALSSVINQTYKGTFEIIVVNDGSTDSSAKVVEDFKIRNPDSVIKLINQENGGVSRARNTGLKNATGDFIALLDSDDAWYEEKIDVQLEIFNNNSEVDFLGASFEGFGLKNKAIGGLIKIEFKMLLFKNYFQPSTILFRRKVLDNVGWFDETQRYAEEGNYFMRVAKLFNCYFLNRNLIFFGDGKAGFGESGLSANLKEMEKGELKNLKFVYTQGWINTAMYASTVCYSLLKYFRRVIIVKLR